MSNKILDIKDLSFQYKNPDLDSNESWIDIFNNIDLSIHEKSIIGIVGESGCGKTTLAKAIVNYHYLGGYTINNHYKMSGDILYYQDSEIYSYNKDSQQNKNYNDLKPPPIQMVFQDPRTALNMDMKLSYQLREAIKLKNKGSKKEIEEQVYINANKFQIAEHLDSTPKDLSGGQRRRFGLAKIISSKPRLIIADEPVSSLDVSIKQDIMNVLFDLIESNISIVIISHDISLLQKNADLIYVMANGKIVEEWNPKNEPKHPETIKLNNDSKFVNKFIDDFRK